MKIKMKKNGEKKFKNEDKNEKIRKIERENTKLKKSKKMKKTNFVWYFLLKNSKNWIKLKNLEKKYKIEKIEKKYFFDIFFIISYKKNEKNWKNGRKGKITANKKIYP